MEEERLPLWKSTSDQPDHDDIQQERSTAPPTQADSVLGLSVGARVKGVFSKITNVITDRGVLLGLLTAIAMGGQFTVVKLVQSYTPFQIMWYRSMSATLLLVFTKWDLLADYDKTDWLHLIMHGNFNTGSLLLAYAALGSVTQVGNITAIVTNQAIPAAILGLIFLGDPLRCRHIFSFMVNLVGIVLLCKPTYLFHSGSIQHDQNDTSEVTGAIFSIASLSCYVAASMGAKVLATRGKMDPAFVTFCNGVNGAIASTVVILWSRECQIFPLSTEGLAIAAASIFSIGGVFSMLKALETVTVTVMSILFSLSIPVAFTLGVLFLGETPDILSLLGACLTIASTFVYISQATTSE